MLGVTDPEPRSVPGRPQAAATTASARRRTTCNRLHLPRQASTARPRSAGRRSTPGWREPTAARGPRRLHDRTSRPRPDDWSAGGWPRHRGGGVVGRRRCSPARRRVPVPPGRRRSGPGSAWSRHSRSTTPPRTSSYGAARPALPGGRRLGLARGQDQGRPLQSTADLLREFPQLALATLLLAENALGGQARTGPALSWRCSPPTAATCCSSTRATRTRRPRPRGLRELAAPWHATAARRPGPAVRSGAGPARWCPDGQVRTGRSDSVTAATARATRRCCAAVRPPLRSFPPPGLPGDPVYDGRGPAAYNHLVLRASPAACEPPRACRAW